MYEETQKNLSKASEHCDRLTKKIEVITFDYNELEKRAAMTDTELRAEVRESQIRLSSYERMEKVFFFLYNSIDLCYYEI